MYIFFRNNNNNNNNNNKTMKNNNNIYNIYKSNIIKAHNVILKLCLPVVFKFLCFFFL
jgi:hypothetical protein